MFNDLYTLTSEEVTAQVISWKIKLNPDSDIFKAHFPGNPILPGACQLEVFRQLASHITGCRVRISEVKNIKFLKVVDPSQTTALTVNGSFSGDPGSGARKLTVTAVDPDEPSVTYTKASLLIE